MHDQKKEAEKIYLEANTSQYLLISKGFVDISALDENVMFIPDIITHSQILGDGWILTRKGIELIK